ncbi:hypothetical protein HDU77_006850 [Chytriomyces hyalinus]|nr:hypothetical protein HDU77_006850 [Chytriomyces hyalinus]
MPDEEFEFDDDFDAATLKAIEASLKTASVNTAATSSSMPQPLVAPKRQLTLFEALGGNPSKVSTPAATSASRPAPAKKNAQRPANTLDSFVSHSAHNNAILDDPNAPISSLVPHTHAINGAALKSWLYPTNCPVREYQFNVIQASMFQNTLVALPTGLGKTFIAAVVMFNFFRWFPESKIVFMAPTKPLVAQQIEACYKITGIPQEVTDEMTGNANPEARRRSWATKRVFFLTPQVMQNDLNRDSCPADKVVLVVIDEAHKASGKHAYCEVVRMLSEAGAAFRVLALTATPGSDVKTVQNVIENLHISKIEIRTEDSLDIKPYTHERNLCVEVIKPSPDIMAIGDLFKRVMAPYLKRLNDARAFYGNDLASISRFMLMKAREEYKRKNPGASNDPRRFQIEADFSLCISLCESYTHLLQIGIHMFLVEIENYIGDSMDPQAKVSKTKERLLQNPDFVAMLKKARSHIQTPGSVSHPKLTVLVEAVVGHFRDHTAAVNRGERDWETRVMVFSNFRESVSEIKQALSNHEPLVKVMSFVGQSSGKKGGMKGCTQKEQLELIQTFQRGGYNVLVATCIGEEGLDIGDVDLIVCFDAQNSPIRMLQRMGRTGRKRDGKVVLLLSEGKEEEAHRRSQIQYKTVQKAIIEGQGAKLKMYAVEDKDRLFPKGVRPDCVKENLEIQAFDIKKKSIGGIVGGTIKAAKAAAASTAIANVRSVSNVGNQSSGPYLSSANQQEYDEQIWSVQTAAALKKMPSLSACLVWQTMQLPTFKVQSSSLSRGFVNIMQMTELLAADEDQSKEDEQCRRWTSHLDMDDRDTIDSLRRSGRKWRTQVKLDVPEIPHNPLVETNSGNMRREPTIRQRVKGKITAISSHNNIQSIANSDSESDDDLLDSNAVIHGKKRHRKNHVGLDPFRAKNYEEESITPVKAREILPYEDEWEQLPQDELPQDFGPADEFSVAHDPSEDFDLEFQRDNDLFKMPESPPKFVVPSPKETVDENAEYFEFDDDGVDYEAMADDILHVENKHGTPLRSATMAHLNGKPSGCDILVSETPVVRNRTYRINSPDDSDNIRIPETPASERYKLPLGVPVLIVPNSPEMQHEESYEAPIAMLSKSADPTWPQNPYCFAKGPRDRPRVFVEWPTFEEKEVSDGATAAKTVKGKMQGNLHHPISDQSGPNSDIPEIAPNPESSRDIEIPSEPEMLVIEDEFDHFEDSGMLDNIAYFDSVMANELELISKTINSPFAKPSPKPRIPAPDSNAFAKPFPVSRDPSQRPKPNPVFSDFSSPIVVKRAPAPPANAPSGFSSPMESQMPFVRRPQQQRRNYVARSDALDDEDDIFQDTKPGKLRRKRSLGTQGLLDDMFDQPSSELDFINEEEDDSGFDDETIGPVNPTPVAIKNVRQRLKKKPRKAPKARGFEQVITSRVQEPNSPKKSRRAPRADVNRDEIQNFLDDEVEVSENENDSGDESEEDDDGGDLDGFVVGDQSFGTSQSFSAESPGVSMYHRAINGKPSRESLALEGMLSKYRRIEESRKLRHTREEWEGFPTQLDAGADAVEFYDDDELADFVVDDDEVEFLKPSKKRRTEKPKDKARDAAAAEEAVKILPKTNGFPTAMTPISRAIMQLPSSDAKSFALEGPSPVHNPELFSKHQKDLLFLDPGGDHNPHVEKLRALVDDDRLTILVDNREIKSGVTSVLKNKHKCRLEFRQLAAGDYILSNRVAIERKSKSDLLQSAYSKRIYEQIDLISKMYSKPYLLIEMDSAPQESITARNQFEGLVASFIRQSINVIFSNSRDDTARLISEIALSEARQGMRIKIPTHLPDKSVGAMAFLMSIPGVSDATCFEIMQPDRFANLRVFLKSDENELLQKIPGMTKTRAKQIVDYLKRCFDEKDSFGIGI